MRLISCLSFLFTLTACQHQANFAPPGDFSQAPGWASVFQTYTSDTQTTFNILRPQLADVAYYVQTDEGLIDNFRPESARVIAVKETIRGPQAHWVVDRLVVSQLKPQTSYRLVIVKKRFGAVTDWRRFETLDLRKKQVRFAIGSCMSDSHSYEHVRGRIWHHIEGQKPDFLMLLGDQVYVDDFDFVAREKATEHDLWARYIESFRKIPLFHSRKLIPLLAVWDDHDFGTNNSDKNFKSKVAAQKVFTAFFGGQPIPGVYERGQLGVYFSFSGFGQKFLLMDDRYFREPAGNHPFAQWGEEQHKWFRSQLEGAQGPVWLANGGQFFAKATFVEQKGSARKQINESFVDDHPQHYRNLIQDIQKAKQPVLFLSGDIHYSEISRIEANLLGFETYEVTSSPLHSYIFRSPTGEDSWLNNPRRIMAVKEHNYLMVNAQVVEGGVDFSVTSWGVKKSEPYLQENFQVRKAGQTDTAKKAL